MSPRQLQRLSPNASKSVLPANSKDYGSGRADDLPSAQVSNAQPSKQSPSLERQCEGKAPGTGCPVVCFTLRRVRLLDIDAKSSSIKDLLDGLQYAGLVDGDREGQISLEVRQEKVAHYREEETEIVIFYP